MRVIQSSFAGGELAPSLHARSDLAKYHVGAKELTNIYVQGHGGIANRGGTVFVGEALKAEGAYGYARLIPFLFSGNQRYSLEFSHLAMRIIVDGGHVVYPEGHEIEGEIVSIVSPYDEEDLAMLKYSQVGDSVYLAHASYPPKVLVRQDHHDWSFSSVLFIPAISAPLWAVSNPIVYSKAPGSTTKTIKYRLTAATEPGEESLASTDQSIVVDSPWPVAATVTLTWQAHADAYRIHIYKNVSGSWGWIGSVEGTETQFKDEYIDPAYSRGAPGQTSRDPFDSEGNYPSTVGIYQQRLILANTALEPQTVWTSKTGALNNFGINYPLRSDDAITVTLASRMLEEVRHLIPMSELLVLTASAEWQLGNTGEALTPVTAGFNIQSYRGSSHVVPLVVGTEILFVQQSGSVVRTLGYSFDRDGYDGQDMTILSKHLFDGHSIKAWAYQQNPDSVIWAVRDDGILLSFTYLKEHEVWAWARHETQGYYEDICSLPGDLDTQVYFVVRRTINGVEKRFIEMQAERIPNNEVEMSFFVDCGLSYIGTPTTTISGLDHLAGEAVAVLADGNVVNGLTVDEEDGSITLPTTASIVHIGLPYNAKLRTLPIDVDSPDTGSKQGARKRILAVTLKLNNTRGAWVGPDDDTDLAVEAKMRTDEPWGDPVKLFSGDKHIVISGVWNTEGGLVVEMRDPLPLSVLAIISEITVGDE